MADAIKSVVVQIETELDSKGIDQLTKGLNQSDKLAQTLKRQLETVNTTLKNVSSRDITLKGGQRSVKELNDLRTALVKTAQEYETLSVEQKKTLTQLLETNEEVIKSLQEGNEAVLESKGGMEGYLRAINIVTPALGQHGVAISLVVSNYLEYIQAQKNGTQGATTFGSVISALSNKWVALGAAVAGVIGVGLNEYFGKTDEGADKLDQTLNGLKETGKSLLGSLANLAASGFNAVTGNFTKAGEDLRAAGRLVSDAFSGEANQRGVDFSKTLDLIEDKAANLRLQTALLNVEFAQLRETLTAEIITIDDANNALSALTKLNEVNSKLAKSQLELKQAELDVAIQRAANFSQFDRLTAETIRQAIATGNLSDITGQYREQIIGAFEALKAVEEQEATRGRQIERQGKGIINQAAEIGNSFAEALDQVNKSFANTEETIGKFVRNTIKPEDLANAKNSTVKAVTEITAEFDKLIKLGEQVAPGLFTGSLEEQLKRAGQLNIPIEFIQEVQDRFKFIGEQAARVFAKEFEVSLLPAFSNTKPIKLPEIKAVTKKPKLNLVQQIFGEDNEQEARKALEAINSSIQEAFNTFIDAEIRKTDFLISEQERRIDEVNKLASLGNAEQLQLEQERLNNLLNERRKFEEQQAAINAASALSATAASAAYFVGAIAKDSFTKDPILAIANAIALVATIAAGVAQLSSIAQGFAEGTESVQPKGQGQRAPSDTVPAWLTPGERVVPLEINKALQGISNDQLPRYVALGKMMEQGYSTQINFGSNNEAVALLKEQNELLKQNTRAISDQQIDIQFDHDGMIINQRKVKRHQEKVRALVR